MTPYALAAEQRSEPLGLDDTRPRLSRKLSSDRRGAAQTAYRITAAARATDLDESARLLWDSGRRDSTETLRGTVPPRSGSAGTAGPSTAASSPRR
jgi:alpha-L-rhamnosidase